MRWPVPDLDPLSTSAGFALLAGVLSLADPYFVGLALALAAFTASLWFGQVVVPGDRALKGPVGVPRWVGAGVLVVGWGFALVGSRWVGGGGGLGLGVASAALWLTAPPPRGRRWA